MSTKIFLLIFATFLIVQTSLAEDKINRDQLNERVIEFYIQMIRQAIASISQAYEPIINEVKINKDTTTDKNYTLKVAELKEVVQRITDTPLTKRDQNILLFDISTKSDAVKNYIRGNPNLSEQNVLVRKAYNDIEKTALQLIERFDEQGMAEIEKYWKGLTPLEQQEQQKLRDDINQIKTEESQIKSEENKIKKFMSLDDIFDLRSEIREKLLAV